MYLFSNEGEHPLETQVTLLVNADNGQMQDTVTPVMVNLWRGEAKRLADVQRNADRVLVNISLQPRETVLVICETMESLAEEWTAPEKDCEEVDLGDFTEKFRLVEKKDNRAVYVLDYTAEAITGKEYFTVRAEEMVECYCNGELSDVAFWAPYVLRTGHLLTKGKNELKVVVTGNAANIYNNAKIPYGLCI